MRLLPFFFALSLAAGPWHFLTIGGGYSPDGNQVSLEKNVQFFQRLLAAMGQGKAPHHLLFADGNAAGRDLHFEPPKARVPYLNDLLGLILSRSENLTYSYRSHTLQTAGEATTANIDRWFDAGHDDKRFFVYFTGHGGRGPKKRPENTMIHLWNKENIRVADFAKRLDKLPVDSEVVLVMVQCYSGGFANLIFKEGDPKKGLADQVRAGFFATVQDHYAAGCTPDINEANYQDYSSSFFAALWGVDRLGKPVKTPDYDGDGTVSFAEAHAYTMIHSETIDAPVKTSDLFLRTFSDLGESEMPLTEILERADSAERAVLRGLVPHLPGKKPPSLIHAREKADALAAERKELDEQIEDLLDQQKKLRKKIATALKAQWPELDNPWHPRVRQLMRKPHSEAIIAAIEKHPDYIGHSTIDDKLDLLDDRYMEIDAVWPDWERYARTAENVVLRHRLPAVADSAIQARFAQLLALEGGSLTDQ